MAFDNEELKQLEDLNKKVVTGALMQFWDEVLEPNLVVKKDLEEMAAKKDLVDAEKRIKEETTTKIMKESRDTRDFIAKKVAEVGGGSVARDKIIIGKVDSTIDILVEEEKLPSEAGRKIKNISPFPIAP